ncbi:MAG: ABC transporter ATP-binding protein [Bacillota bacterium]
MSVLSVKGLSKDYRGHRALDNLNLEVPRGSVFGFLGPNGSGKTTTIKILTGLLQATAGSATILDCPVAINLDRALKRRIGYLPEEVNFPEALSGFEVMEFVYRGAGLPAAGARSEIVRLLDHFNLLDASRRRCASYSRGMKQRLGLACALLHRPELLILDEPVSALDPEGRREVLELMVTSRAHATVFFSSHVLADVERVCDQVAVLNQGRLVVQAPLAELLRSYTFPKYRVTVRQAPPPELLAEIGRRPWARQVDPGPDGAAVFTVEAAPEISGRLEEELLPLLIQENQVVTSFQREQPNLEQIFLDLLKKHHQNGTKEEAGNAASLK